MDKTITVNINKSAALNEWMRKEKGSFEDHNESENHVFAILQRCNGKIVLTTEEANTIIKSGSYQAAAWEPNEIYGGAKTMRTISGIVDKVKRALMYKSPVS